MPDHTDHHLPRRQFRTISIQDPAGRNYATEAPLYPAQFVDEGVVRESIAQTKKRSARRGRRVRPRLLALARAGHESQNIVNPQMVRVVRVKTKTMHQETPVKKKQANREAWGARTESEWEGKFETFARRSREQSKKKKKSKKGKKKRRARALGRSLADAQSIFKKKGAREERVEEISFKNQNEFFGTGSSQRTSGRPPREFQLGEPRGEAQREPRAEHMRQLQIANTSDELLHRHLVSASESRYSKTSRPAHHTMNNPKRAGPKRGRRGHSGSWRLPPMRTPKFKHVQKQLNRSDIRERPKLYRKRNLSLAQAFADEDDLPRDPVEEMRLGPVGDQEMRRDLGLSESTHVINSSNFMSQVKDFGLDAYIDLRGHPVGAPGDEVDAHFRYSARTPQIRSFIKSKKRNYKNANMRRKDSPHKDTRQPTAHAKAQLASSERRPRRRRVTESEATRKSNQKRLLKSDFQASNYSAKNEDMQTQKSNFVEQLRSTLREANAEAKGHPAKGHRRARDTNSSKSFKKKKAAHALKKRAQLAKDQSPVLEEPLREGSLLSEVGAEDSSGPEETDSVRPNEVLMSFISQLMQDKKRPLGHIKRLVKETAPVDSTEPSSDQHDLAYSRLKRSYKREREERRRLEDNLVKLIQSDHNREYILQERKRLQEQLHDKNEKWLESKRRVAELEKQVRELKKQNEDLKTQLKTTATKEPEDGMRRTVKSGFYKRSEERPDWAHQSDLFGRPRRDWQRQRMSRLTNPRYKSFDFNNELDRISNLGHNLGGPRPVDPGAHSGLKGGVERGAERGAERGSIGKVDMGVYYTQSHVGDFYRQENLLLNRALNNQSQISTKLIFKLEKENMLLEKAKSELLIENQKIKDENNDLKSRVEELKQQNAELQSQARAAEPSQRTGSEGGTKLQQSESERLQNLSILEFENTKFFRRKKHSIEDSDASKRLPPRSSNRTQKSKSKKVSISEQSPNNALQIPQVLFKEPHVSQKLSLCGDKNDTKSTEKDPVTRHFSIAQDWRSAGGAKSTSSLLQARPREITVDINCIEYPDGASESGGYCSVEEERAHKNIEIPEYAKTSSKRRSRAKGLRDKSGRSSVFKTNEEFSLNKFYQEMKSNNFHLRSENSDK